MNQCPYCGFQNPADIHICLGCASSLKRHCPNCNAEVLISSRFCGQCGVRLEMSEGDSLKQPENISGINLQERMLQNLLQKMPSSLVNKFTQASRDLYGQRREVTVLIVEISDYLRISTELDTESLYLAVDDIINLLAEIVYKYEGTIDKYTGSGLMAIFGIPLNHENDPERAVRAGIEMQDRMKKHSERLLNQYQQNFHVQIGINTGSVIAGHLGNQHQMEYTVIGDTVHLANQLQTSAGQGNIFVSFQTYQRSLPIFNFKRVPLIGREGTSESTNVFQPLEIRSKPGRVRGLPGLQVPMVGRTEQLNKLIKIYKQATLTETSHIVICSGEAGIGKSRLIAEFGNYLSSQPIIMVIGTCASYMRITPYRVVADVLRNILSISELDPPNDQRRVLRQRLEEHGLDRNDIFPYLMHVLGLLQSDPVMNVQINLLDPSMLRRQTHYALRMFFVAESRRSPLILVFDDLHWVDQASGQFLEYFCQSLEEFPLILIMVARDFGKYGLAESIKTAAGKHIREPHEINVLPLDEPDASLLVNQLVSENTKAANKLKEIIITRAGGNPYYTEELVRVLVDHGGLVLQDGYWHVTDEAAKLIQEVPGTLGDIILARFDHLTEPQKHILLNASVLGESFSVRLLMTLVNTLGEDITDHLIELEERDFLVHTKFDIEEGYLFKHPLLQETIYKTVLKRDLQKLHSQVAQAIETGNYWLPGERTQVLAYHLSEGLNPENAIPYLLVSAQEAYSHFANDTVVQLYRQALSLMNANPDTQNLYKEQALVGLAQSLKFTSELEEAAGILMEIVDRIPPTTAASQQQDSASFQIQIEALRELADIRAREGNLEFAVELLKQGMDLLGETGRRTYPNIWRRLVDRLAWVYFRQRNLEDAYNLADLALLDTPTWEAEDPITVASLYNTIGGIYWIRSRFLEAIESVKHSLEIYKNLHYHWGMANALTNLGILHYSTERWAQAVNYLEQADELRRDYRDDPERPVNLKNLGEVLIDMGNFQEAREKLETSKEISQRLGLDLSQAYAEFGLCRLSLLEGNLSKAKDHLAKVKPFVEPFDEVNDRVSNYFQLDALIKIKENDLKGAERSAEHALMLAKQGDMTGKQVEMLRILGTIRAELKDWDQAETYLTHSRQLAQQLSDRFSEAKARYELGLLYWTFAENSQTHEQSIHQKQAESSIDEAIKIFENLGAKHDLLLARHARLWITNGESVENNSIENTKTTEEADFYHSPIKLGESGRYQAVIISCVLTPRQGRNEEFIFETIAFLIPPIIEFIKENGGKVFRDQDSLTAIFGGSISHEDDPERAIETGMQIINYYQELDQQTDLSVSIKIGIAMGEIVGGKMDLDQVSEMMAVGKPVQLARNLADACPSGKVWVTQPVRNHTSYRYEYAPISPTLNENLSEVIVFQFEGLREQMLPVRGLIGLKTPFIGRKKELEAMHKMSLVLDEGTGAIIWIEGDGGIGKSRLMREFSSQLLQHGYMVLSGACTSRRSEHAFSLFSDLLLQTFDIHPNYSSKVINEQIDLKLNQLSQELLETRPFLQLLMGVQPSGALGEQVIAMEPEQLRRQTFVAIHRLMSVLASKQPLALFLDDLQWIDSISADLLLYLSHQIVSQRILLVCAQRQKEISPFEQILARTRRMHPEKITQLTIRPLTNDECQQLLSEFLSSADLPQSILSLIVQQSGGNPYYIEEFVRLLVEKDYLRLIRGRLVTNRTIQASSLEIPKSLESLIRARVDSLDSAAKELLQVASVIGHRFDQTVLALVSKHDYIDKGLAVLQTRGMLTPASDVDHWEFSHPLIEVSVYNTLLRAQRRILHQRTAVVLENQWQGHEGEHAEDLAYHYGKADIHAKALHYLILAGERAAARHANDVALSYYEQAADLQSAVPDVSDESRWRIIRGMGEVHQFIGNYDTSLAVLKNGRDLLHSASLSPAQRAGIFRRMGDTAHKKGDQDQAILFLQQALEVLDVPEDIPSHTEAALIYARLGWCLFMLSDLDNAKDSVMKSRYHAGQANNITTLAMTENHLGGILFRQGDFQQAMQHTRTAMSYWREIGYSWGVAAALSNLGILEIAAGNWQAAFNSIKRSLELRQKMGDVDGVAITNHNLGLLARDQGDMIQAESYFRDSLAVSKPFQMNFNTANSLVSLSLSLLYQEKHAEAEKTLKEGLHLAEEINAPDVIVEAYCVAAEKCLFGGQLVEAESNARNACELASQIGLSTLQVTAYRLIAESLLRQGKLHQADDALGNAWEALAEGHDRLEEGRLHTVAMRIEHAKQDYKQSKKHHLAAEEIFQKLGAARDLKMLGSIEIP
jgi:predicted ATPase/class 3 adenylate cyclase/Tfp pilus assembly protein PilF